MKFFIRRKQEEVENEKNGFSNTKKINAVESLKCVKNKIVAKIKDIQIKVKKIDNSKAIMSIKKSFATLKVGYIKVQDKVVEGYGIIKDKTAPSIDKINKQIVDDFGKFKDFAKYKLHNLSYDFGVLRDAINEKLLNTNLKLYNRAYYNYAIAEKSKEVGYAKSGDFANQIYHEDIGFLFNYPQCYANMVADYNAQMLQNELRNAILRSANLAGSEIVKSGKIHQQKANISELNKDDKQLTKEQEKKEKNKQNHLQNFLLEDNGQNQNKSTELKDLEKSFLNFGNRVAFNKKVIN